MYEFRLDSLLKNDLVGEGDLEGDVNVLTGESDRDSWNSLSLRRTCSLLGALKGTA